MSISRRKSLSVLVLIYQEDHLEYLLKETLGAGVDEDRVFLIVSHPVGLKYVPVLDIRKITLMDPTSWWFPGLTLMRIQSLSKDSFWTIVT